jgi:hypothetical protein
MYVYNYTQIYWHASVFFLALCRGKPAELNLSRVVVIVRIRVW